MTLTYREKLVDFIRREANPPDKFSHQERLYRLAVELAKARPYEDDVVFGAAWIHDLGVFIGHRPADPTALAKWDNLAYVMAKGPGVLKELGWPADKIPAVMEAVRTHMPSASPATFEGVLIREADILEQLGATGILRIVSKVGRDTRFRLFPDALRVLEKNARELPGLLTLETARIEAARRADRLRAFLEWPRLEGVTV